MSWLSELFGGGGGEDPLAVRQREESARAQSAREAQAASDRALQIQMDYLNQLRADEQRQLEEVKAADPTATRSAALSTVGGTFAPEFESSYIPESITDPYETEVYGQHRGKADEFLNNLFKRGVITETGRQRGTQELEEQAPRVRTQLQGIADALIGQGRGRLTDIAGRAKERASTLGVGEAFDITPYSTALGGELGKFTGGLGDLFKGQVTGDLFDTSTLASIAGGAGGGAGSGTVFDPKALAGVPSDEEDPFSGQKPVQKRTSTVF